MKWTVFGVVLLSASLGAQTWKCPAGGSVTITYPNGVATIVCTAPPPVQPPAQSAPTIPTFGATATTIALGQSVTFSWTVTGVPAPTLTLASGAQAIAVTNLTSFTWTPDSAGVKVVTLTAANGVSPNAAKSWTVTVTAVTPVPPIVIPPPVDPPPATGQVWGNVTAAELGECSAAAHDKFLVDGGDGWKYRTYHPQQDPTGCIYGHEHGDDPASQRNTWVRANWDGRMGYAARRDTTHPGQPNGHEEPHNGYKVHVVNVGDVNDEGRINQTATTSMPHMGTAGPARFSVSRHSVSIADYHQNGIHHTTVHAMFETGTKGNPVETPCPPVSTVNRAPSPTKDGLILGQPCKVNSGYEIWGMVLDVLRANGAILLRKFVTPAVFDPITVHNPANPGEVVYAWDPRVAAFKNFPFDDWSGNRGCQREGYAQVGEHYNGADPSEEYLLDVRTNRIVAAASAFTTRLVVGRSDSGGKVPFSSDIVQYKQRRDHCGLKAKLSLTN